MTSVSLSPRIECLVFVPAGNRDATWTNIADYNTFVDDAANAGGSYLKPLGADIPGVGVSYLIDERASLLLALTARSCARCTASPRPLYEPGTPEPASNS